MQNQDRFGKIKVNWVKFFCLFGVFLSFSAGVYMSELVAAETKSAACQVHLEFTRDEAGGQLVHYRLFLEVKNKKAQPVTAFSVLWLDKNDEILGNSNADFKAENVSLEVDQAGAGQCSPTVQTISNRLIQSFSQSLWTDIVNSQLKTFERIKSCKIIGYRYESG